MLEAKRENLDRRIAPQPTGGEHRRGSMKRVVGSALCAVVSMGCYSSPPPYLPTVPLPAASELVARDRWVYQSGSVVALDAKGRSRTPTEEEVGMASRGFEIANTVLLSDCFSSGVVASNMTHTKNQSSREVFQTLTRSPQLALKVTFYDGTSKHGTIGWDDPGNDPNNVHMNGFFVKTAYLVADNLLHEAAHARGFIHKSSKEYTSVPYMMNHIFEACAGNFNLQRETPQRLDDESKIDE